MTEVSKQTVAKIREFNKAVSEDFMTNVLPKNYLAKAPLVTLLYNIILVPTDTTEYVEAADLLTTLCLSDKLSMKLLYKVACCETLYDYLNEIGLDYASFGMSLEYYVLTYGSFIAQDIFTEYASIIRDAMWSYCDDKSREIFNSCIQHVIATLEVFYK